MNYAREIFRSLYSHRGYHDRKNGYFDLASTKVSIIPALAGKRGPQLLLEIPMANAAGNPRVNSVSISLGRRFSLLTGKSFISFHGSYTLIEDTARFRPPKDFVATLISKSNSFSNSTQNWVGLE